MVDSFLRQNATNPGARTWGRRSLKNPAQPPPGLLGPPNLTQCPLTSLCLEAFGHLSHLPFRVCDLSCPDSLSVPPEHLPLSSGSVMKWPVRYILRSNAAVLGGMRATQNLATKTQNSPVTTPVHTCCDHFSALHKQKQTSKHQTARVTLQPSPSMLWSISQQASAQPCSRCGIYPSWSPRHTFDGNGVTEVG